MQSTQQNSLFSWLTNFFTNLSTKKAVLIIITLGIVVFPNGFFNGFVGDDGPQIIENPLVQSITNVPSFFSGSTFYSGSSQKLGGSYYKPLLTTVFTLIYALFGPNPFQFHVTQILLHIVNACILFLFLRYLFKQSIAFLLSLIFLIHPVNSEVPYYISDMQDSLFFLLGIFALWSVTYFKPKKALILTAILLFLSLLSKETGILFLFISILFASFYPKKGTYSLLVFSVVILVFYAILRANAVGILGSPGISPIDKLTLPIRLLNIPAILFFYLKQFFFPLHLSSSYQWIYTQANFMNFILPLIIDSLFIFLIIYFAVILYRNHPRKYFQIYIFFTIWFSIGIILHMQLFPLDATVAERWFYFPIVGLLGMFGVLLEVFQFNIRNKWSLLFISILLLLLSVRTFVRSFDWRDNFTLYTHDAQVSKNDYVLEKGIAGILALQGKAEEAKSHAEISVAMNPYSINYNVLGLIYEQLGDYAKAKEAFLTGLKFGDNYVIYENLAGLSLIAGDSNENIKFIKHALNKFSKDDRLWLYLAIEEYKINKIDEAKYAITQAYSFNQSQDISTIYNIIMNNQPLNIKTTTGFR